MELKMKQDMPFLKIFDNIDLVPQQWQTSGDTSYYTFNPSILKIKEGFAMCYRVVTETHKMRKLATCHLTNNFEIVKGTVTPLSDLIEFAVPEDFGNTGNNTIGDPDKRSVTRPFYFLKSIFKKRKV